VIPLAVHLLIVYVLAAGPATLSKWFPPSACAASRISEDPVLPPHLAHREGVALPVCARRYQS
jgi:hypothetical protein